MKTAATYWARIFVGLRVGYTDKLHCMDDVLDVCKEYCDKVGLCVTVTPTTYIYTKGQEDGVIIELINYPRFPKFQQAIRDHAQNLAHQLRSVCEQNRVSIMFPDNTVMLGPDK